MSRASDNSNAVVYAAEQVCALYGVQVTREQSRMFNVQGAAGRWRPMFIGQWTDAFGKIHRAGKPDLLARPKILPFPKSIPDFRMAVPLWIECKSGEGRMKPEQMAFKNWVEQNGDTYLLIHDDVRPLLVWFEEHGVERHCNEVEMRNVVEPMDASCALALPCRWCKASRELHIGVAHGCAGKSGKVWSPDLKAARQ